jgi:hypothetical protein
MMFIENILGILIAICCNYGFYLYSSNTVDVGFRWPKETASEIPPFKTQIVSEDPLLVYIDNFVSEVEVSELLDIG